ncbi:DUF4350 domain-containing protein [Propionibacteriaceae bacterium Y2011]
MPPSAAAPTTRTPSSPVSPDHTDDAPAARPWWRRLLTPLILVAVLALAVGLLAVGLVAISPATPGGIRDSDSAGRSAIGALLRDEQISVAETQSWEQAAAAADRGAAILVTDLRPLSPGTLDALIERRPARIVVERPRNGDLNGLGLPVRAGTDATAPATDEPNCDDPAARRAGRIATNGSPARYRLTQGARPTVACYGDAGTGHQLLVFEERGVEFVIMPAVTTNRVLAEAGNASLAMQLLGAHPELMVYDPLFGDQLNRGGGWEGGQGRAPTLLPDTWLHGVGLAVVAMVVVAVWQGRRLGPIITEKLPVVVPASETVEGHGRLYARIGARDRAAELIRTAATRRLSRGLGHADDPDVLARALADRTGWSYGEVRHLLTGPAPTTDDQLVTLKRKLDALEQEARRP